MIAVTFALALIVIAFYFLPTSIACSRSHRNSTAIFVLNLLLGWTMLGWVLALVWACTVGVEVRHS